MFQAVHGLAACGGVYAGAQRSLVVARGSPREIGIKTSCERVIHFKKTLLWFLWLPDLIDFSTLRKSTESATRPRQAPMRSRWGVAPAYLSAPASSADSPLQLAARQLGRHFSGVVSTVQRSWSALLHGKNCSDDTPLGARAGWGGRRREPIVLTHVSTPLPVSHTVLEHAALYNDTLWMWMDPSARPSPTSLWYVPGNMMLLSDHVDLARALRLPSRMGQWPGIVRMMRLAAVNLSAIDTILFTHHFDSNGATCRKQHPQGCCHLVPELVALHEWRPLSCPAHPRLREGIVPRHCACTVPQAIGWGRERNARLQNRTLRATEPRTYLC
jgi:hypothetical protein